MRHHSSLLLTGVTGLAGSVALVTYLSMAACGGTKTTGGFGLTAEYCRLSRERTSAIRKRYFARPATTSSKCGVYKATLPHSDLRKHQDADVHPAPACLVY